MKAKIKYIFSPDIDTALEDFIPKDEGNFGFVIRMIVCPEGQEGEESFDLMLCTPKWLNDNYPADEIIFGRHYLIVFKYDYKSIYKKLSDYVNGIDAKSWGQIGDQIGKIGYWEFEDYESKN
jgi:hypothetical protein